MDEDVRNHRQGIVSSYRAAAPKCLLPSLASRQKAEAHYAVAARDEGIAPEEEASAAASPLNSEELLPEGTGPKKPRRVRCMLWNITVAPSCTPPWSSDTCVHAHAVAELASQAGQSSVAFGAGSRSRQRAWGAFHLRRVPLPCPMGRVGTRRRHNRASILDKTYPCRSPQPCERSRQNLSI